MTSHLYLVRDMVWLCSCKGTARNFESDLGCEAGDAVDHDIVNNRSRLTCTLWPGPAYIEYTLAASAI